MFGRDSFGGRAKPHWVTVATNSSKEEGQRGSEAR